MMTEKVFCWACEYLIRDTSYCTMKQKVVNTCMKKCDDYSERNSF